jgi:DNA-binding transcriptional LysR family regulator
MSGAVDVAVLAVHGNEPRVPAGIETRIISEEPLRLIGAPGGSLAGRLGATIDELRGVPVILPERGTALRELLAAGFAEAGFSPLPFFETSDPRTIRRLASAGLGVSAIPASWLEDPGPIVGIAEFADPAPTYRVALLAGSDGRRPVRDLLVEHLVRHFAAGRDDVAAPFPARSPTVGR